MYRILVAGHVLSMLGKFYTETLIGTLVKPGNESLHNQTRNQLHVAESRQGRRIQVFMGCSHNFYVGSSHLRFLQV